MRRIAAIAAATLLAMAGQAEAAEIEVTGDEQTGLGAAIVAAEPGDVILIPAGNYYLTEGDVLEEKDLTLRGEGENLTTIIPTGGGDALLDEGVTVELADTAEALEPSENEASSQEEDESASGGIETKAQIIALVVTFGILLLVLDLVRRRRLSERYAIIWMTAAFALLVLSIWTGGLDAIAKLMGIQEPANAIFIIAFAVGFLLLLNFSVVSSRLGEEAKVLAQEVARLEQELRLERSLRGGKGKGFSGRAPESQEALDEPPVRGQ